MSDTNARRQIITQINEYRGTACYKLFERLIDLSIEDGKNKLVVENDEQIRGRTQWLTTLKKELNPPETVDNQKDGAYGIS